MEFPEVTPRSDGTVPVAVATGPMLEDRVVVRVPWNRASFLHRKNFGHFQNPIGIHAEMSKEDVAPEVIEAKKAALPAMVRTSSRQKAERMATDLFEMGLKSQRVYGYTVWPTSIQQALVSIGAEKDDIYAQVTALVTHFMVKAENKQKETDSHQVARGWHGHFS